MSFVPTTTVDVYRAQATVDEYGHDVDDFEAVATDWPAHLAPTTRSTRRRGSADDSPSATVDVRGLLKPGLDMFPGDRVQDNADGVVYAVDRVLRAHNYVGSAPTRLNLTRTERTVAA